MSKAAVALSLVIALVVAVACSPTTSGAPGISCTANADCGSGLRCLADALPADGGCESVGMECLEPCTTDAECTASLGAGYTCSSGPCGAAIATCQPAQPATDGGSDASSASDAAIDSGIDSALASDGASPG